MISCTVLIIYSEIPRKQDQFSCNNNTRMWFCTSVITFCCKCATKMCAAKGRKYRPGELCGIWSSAVTVRAGEEDTEDADRATVAHADKGAAGTTPVSSSHTASAMLSQKVLKIKADNVDSCYFAWLKKKNPKKHLQWNLCLHSYHKEYNIQHIITRKARHKENLLISFNLKRDRTGPIWYTSMALLCLSTNTMYYCL